MADTGLKTYRKRPGCKDSGYEFELLLSMLLVVRSETTTDSFNFTAHNWDAGDLDDIVITVKDNSSNRDEGYFMQLKYCESKEERNHIKKVEMLEQSGNYSLIRYYPSYLEIMDKYLNIPNKNFVIYTNTSMHSSVNNLIEIGHRSDDLIHTGGQIYSFTQDSDGYSAFFKHVTPYKEKLKELSEKLDKLEEFSDNLDVFKKLSDNLNKLQKFSDKLHELACEIEKISDKLDSLMKLPNNLEKLYKLSEKLQELSDKLKELSHNLNKLQEFSDQLDELKCEIEKTSDELDSMTKLSNSLKKLNKLSEELEELLDNLKELQVSDQLDELTYEIEKISDKLDLLKKLSNSSEKLNELSEELEELLSEQLPNNSEGSDEVNQTKHVSEKLDELKKLSEIKIEAYSYKIRKEVFKMKMAHSRQLRNVKKHALKQKLQEVLKQVSKWSDDTWREFMGNLKVYTDQMSMEELGQLVLEQYEQLCGSSNTFLHFKNSMYSWRKCNICLTKNLSAFWRDVLQMQRKELMHNIYSKMKSVEKLTFRRSEIINNLKESPHKLIHIICEGTTDISCQHIVQSLSNADYLLVDMRTLRENVKQVLFVWRHYQILVVVADLMDRKRSDDSNIAEEMKCVLTSDPNKKLVLVTNKTNQLSIKCDESDMTSREEEFKFDQLTLRSQEIILGCHIDFQGRPVTLRSLVTDTDDVNADLIVKLLSEEKIAVGRKLTSEISWELDANTDAFHIPRTLLRREIVNKNIFKSFDSCRVAFSGISLSELQLLLPHEAVVQELAENTEIDENCKYFIINESCMFVKLCGLFSQVHWLEKVGESYAWRQSKGDRNNLMDAVPSDKHVRDPEKVTLIVAGPGMGKASEISHLIRVITEENHSTWVVDVNLTEYSDMFKQDNSTYMSTNENRDTVNFSRTSTTNDACVRGSVINASNMKNNFTESSLKNDNATKHTVIESNHSISGNNNAAQTNSIRNSVSQSNSTKSSVTKNNNKNNSTTKNSTNNDSTKSNVTKSCRNTGTKDSTKNSCTRLTKSGSNNKDSTKNSTTNNTVSANDIQSSVTKTNVSESSKITVNVTSSITRMGTTKSNIPKSRVCNTHTTSVRANISHIGTSTVNNRSVTRSNVANTTVNVTQNSAARGKGSQIRTTTVNNSSVTKMGVTRSNAANTTVNVTQNSVARAKGSQIRTTTVNNSSVTKMGAANTTANVTQNRAARGIASHIRTTTANSGTDTRSNVPKITTNVTKMNRNVNTNNVGIKNSDSQSLEFAPLSDAAHELLRRAGNLKTKFEENLFFHELSHGGNIVVIFSGFDKVGSDCLNKVLDTVKEICCSNVRKVLITSRPIMRATLENTFSCFSLSLKPLCYEEQVELLQNMWHIPGMSTHHDSAEFATELRDLYEQCVGIDIQHFTSSPLHAKILGEVFKSEAKEYAEHGKIISTLNIDLLKPFSGFVKEKSMEYCKKCKINLKNADMKRCAEEWKKDSTSFAKLCAIKAFLSQEDLDKLYCNKLEQELGECIRDGRDKLGILQDVECSKPVFVDKNLAEYFVAAWLCENYGPSCNRKFIMDKLFDPEWENVRMFVNHILCTGKDFKLHMAVLRQNLPQVEKLLLTPGVKVNTRDDGGRTPLHLAAMTQNKDVLDRLLQLDQVKGIDRKLREKWFGWTALDFAKKMKWSYAQDVLQK